MSEVLAPTAPLGSVSHFTCKWKSVQLKVWLETADRDLPEVEALAS